MNYKLGIILFKRNRTRSGKNAVYAKCLGFFNVCLGLAKFGMAALVTAYKVNVRQTIN